MAKNVSWRDVLSPELVREIDAEINRQFAEGWRACQRAIAGLEPSRDGAPLRQYDDDSARQYPSDRAPRGLWAALLEQEARERFPQHLLLNESMPAVQARTDQFALARSSLNAAIATLEKQGKLRRDGKKLFWIPSTEDRGETPPPWEDDAEAALEEDRPASAVSAFVRRLDDDAA